MECSGGSALGKRAAPDYRAGCAQVVAVRVDSGRSGGWDHDSHGTRVAFGEVALMRSQDLGARIRASSPTCPIEAI